MKRAIDAFWSDYIVLGMSAAYGHPRMRKGPVGRCWNKGHLTAAMIVTRESLRSVGEALNHYEARDAKLGDWSRYMLIGLSECNNVGVLREVHTGCRGTILSCRPKDVEDWERTVWTSYMLGGMRHAATARAGWLGASETTRLKGCRLLRDAAMRDVRS